MSGRPTQLDWEAYVQGDTDWWDKPLPSEQAYAAAMRLDFAPDICEALHRLNTDAQHMHEYDAPQARYAFRRAYNELQGMIYRYQHMRFERDNLRRIMAQRHEERERNGTR